MTHGIVVLHAGTQYFIYLLKSFELAMKQAQELTKGVMRVRKGPVVSNENGLRQTVWICPDHQEVMIISENEASEFVLPVDVRMN